MMSERTVLKQDSVVGAAAVAGCAALGGSGLGGGGGDGLAAAAREVEARSLELVERRRGAAGGGGGVAADVMVAEGVGGRELVADVEARWVREAQGGSLEAFGKLMVRHERALFNYLRMKWGEGLIEIEDLTQEAFMRAWRYLDRYDARWRFSTWLYTIASRVAITEFQKRKRAGEMVSRLGGMAGETSGVVEGVDLICQNEERNRGGAIWDLAAEVLSEDERSILWLRYGEDFNAAEIGRIMERKTVGVRVILHRARGRLRKELEGMGGAEVEGFGLEVCCDEGR